MPLVVVEDNVPAGDPLQYQLVALQDPPAEQVSLKGPVTADAQAFTF